MRLSIALIISLTSTTVMAAEPSMTTSWDDMTMSQKECLSQAMNAMRAAKVTRNLQTVNTSIFGAAGDYMASIRCAESKAIVIYVVAGPDVDRTSSILDSMRNAFVADSSLLPKKPESAKNSS